MPAGRSLRERRRARTRADIERAALDMFLARGYELTTVEEIAEAALISPRTFFRYFSSKEDVLLARKRDDMRVATRRLEERPPDEPVMGSLRAVVEGFAALHEAERERELDWLRVVTATPQLAAGFLDMVHEMERLLREFIAGRLELDPGDRVPRLAAAAFGTAFRVAAETWHDSGGREDMPTLARENVETLVAPLLESG